MLSEKSKTKQTTLPVACNSEKVGGKGKLLLSRGTLNLKSSELLITSHVLWKLQNLFWGLGASALWSLASQNLNAWNQEAKVVSLGAWKNSYYFGLQLSS